MRSGIRNFTNSHKMQVRAQYIQALLRILSGAENRGFGISTSSDMLIRGLDSSLIILSGRGLLIRDKERNDFTELPEPIYMPGTLVCFTMPVRQDGFTIYEYIGG